MRNSLSGLGRVLAGAAVGLAAVAGVGCVSNENNYKKLAMDAFECSETYIKRPTFVGPSPYKSGFDIQILDFDGIAEIEFYRNKNLVFSTNNMLRLMGNGLWGGDFEENGKLYTFYAINAPASPDSENILINKPFKDYYLYFLYGHDFCSVVDKRNEFTLKIYDKMGNIRTTTLKPGLDISSQPTNEGVNGN